LLAVHFNQLK